METLAKGVYAALAYLEETVESVPKPKHFYLHGVSEIPLESNTITVEIDKPRIPIKPDIGALVSIRNIEFQVKEIEENEIGFKLTLGRL